jgi:hypothetical protein
MELASDEVEVGETAPTVAKWAQKTIHPENYFLDVKM